MNQTLHIFKKDTRRQWVEILASFVALALFAANVHRTWDYSRVVLRSAIPWQSILQLSMLMVPAMWCVLIARAVQDESLVGDRQFWLTRPYEWKQLLAAKALFVLVWVYAPFVLMQAAAMRQAGFSLLARPGDWAFVLLMLCVYVLLPLIAIATTTENFARTSLTVFGAVVADIAGGYLAGQPRFGYESNAPYEFQQWIVAVLIVGALLAVVLQYAKRRVWLTRAVMVATVLLAVGVQTVHTRTLDSQISRAYPVSGTAPVQVVTDVPANYTQLVRLSPSERQPMIYVGVPVKISGVAEGAALQTDDVKITVSDSSGSWTAPWWSSQTMQILPGTHYAEVQIMVPRDQFKRLVLGAATMRVTLALTELSAGEDTTVTLPYEGDVAVRGFGICSMHTIFHLGSQLLCRSAMGRPPLTRVSATSHPKECTDEPMPNAPMTAAGWGGSVYSPTFGNILYVVSPLFVNLNPDWHDGNEMYRTRGFALCPGTPVHFQPYSIAGRTQVSFDVPNSYFKIPGFRMDREENAH